MEQPVKKAAMEQPMKTNPYFDDVIHDASVFCFSVRRISAQTERHCRFSVRAIHVLSIMARLRVLRRRLATLEAHLRAWL